MEPLQPPPPYSASAARPIPTNPRYPPQRNDQVEDDEDDGMFDDPGEERQPFLRSWKFIAVMTFILLFLTRLLLDAIFNPKEGETWTPGFGGDNEKERAKIERQGSYWDTPKPERCVAYGVREYRAYLLNVTQPMYTDKMKSCHYTRIKIHDKVILSPDSCGQDRRGVFGLWKVDIDEFECQPYWGPFSKLECTFSNSGKRKVESRIWGLKRGDDWHALCRSTPAVIDGVAFTKPLTCRDERGRFKGFIGAWELDDVSCSNAASSTA